MEARDRLVNLGLFGAAAVAWLLVGIVVTTRDPLVDPMAGFVGAGLAGAALGGVATGATVPGFADATDGVALALRGAGRLTAAGLDEAAVAAAGLADGAVGAREALDAVAAAGLANERATVEVRVAAGVGAAGAVGFRTA